MLVKIALTLLFNYLQIVGSKKIYVGALVDSYLYTNGHKTAIQLATEIINNSSEILRVHEVVVKYIDINRV